MKLGTVAGIEIRAHYSSLFVFGAVVAVIAYGYLPMATPASTPGERIAVATIITLLLVASVVAHELGHALVARRRGKRVNTISLYLFGGAAQIGGANLTPEDEIAIAIAGPIVSAVLTVLFAVAGFAVFSIRQQGAILFFDVALANAALGAFNMLPGFPMDGGRVLRGILWKRSGNVIAATRRAALGGRIIAYAIVAVGCLVAVRGSLFFGVWAVAIGWFLLSLAHSYYRATVLRAALEGLSAADLCAANLPVLQTSDSVGAAAAHFGVGAKTRSLAVLFGDRPAGIVTDVQVARVPLEEASDRSVATIMTRISEVPVLEPDVDAIALLEVMPLASTSTVIVASADGADFVGIVRREDIVRYVEMVEEVGNSSAASARNLRGLRLARAKPARPDMAQG